MTNLFDELPGDDEEESEETDESIDEETQEEGEAVANSEEFAEKYGFSHDCHCGDDWANGNLAVVSVCYVNMIREALDVLAATRKENLELQVENANLLINKADESDTSD